MRKEKMTFKMQLSFSQKLDLSKFSLSFQKMQKLSGDDDQQMKRQNCLKIKKTVKAIVIRINKANKKIINKHF